MITRRIDELVDTPQLRRGSHVDPSAGGCFMEYASMLAGERWSDHPRCTCPALAQLARIVNDTATAGARQLLIRLVPEVIGLTGRNPAITPALVILCIDSSRACGCDRWSWGLHRRWAARRLAAASAGGGWGRWCRLSEPVYRDGPALRAMVHATAALGGNTPDTPERLVHLLERGIAITRACLRQESFDGHRELPTAAQAGVFRPISRHRRHRAAGARVVAGAAQ